MTNLPSFCDRLHWIIHKWTTENTDYTSEACQLKDLQYLNDLKIKLGNIPQIASKQEKAKASVELADIYVGISGALATLEYIARVCYPKQADSVDFLLRCGIIGYSKGAKPTRKIILPKNYKERLAMFEAIISAIKASPKINDNYPNQLMRWLDMRAHHEYAWATAEGEPTLCQVIDQHLHKLYAEVHQRYYKEGEDFKPILIKFGFEYPPQDF